MRFKHKDESDEELEEGEIPDDDNSNLIKKESFSVFEKKDSSTFFGFSNNIFQFFEYVFDACLRLIPRESNLWKLMVGQRKTMKYILFLTFV